MYILNQNSNPFRGICFPQIMQKLFDIGTENNYFPEKTRFIHVLTFYIMIWITTIYKIISLRQPDWADAPDSQILPILLKEKYAKGLY